MILSRITIRFTLQKSVFARLRFECASMSEEAKRGSDTDSVHSEEDNSQTAAASQPPTSGSDPPGKKKSKTESVPAESKEAHGDVRHRGWGSNWSWKPPFYHSRSQPARDAKYYQNLSLEEKRDLYTCGRKYVTPSAIEPWSEQYKKVTAPKKQPVSDFQYSEELNQKVSWWKGDITCLEIDAIVNAANSSLLGGGGVDGAIHRAAGYSLRDECAELNGCDTGDAKLTSGHRLPAKFILHTVGPINRSYHMLKSCYDRCLQLVLKHGIRSVAFCCIATGVYGYPNQEAAHVALSTIRQWLERDDNASKVDRIIFCVFLPIDVNIYRSLLFQYFPPVEKEARKNTESSDSEIEDMDFKECSNDNDGSSKPIVPALTRAATEPVKYKGDGENQSASQITSADSETCGKADDLLDDSPTKDADGMVERHLTDPATSDTKDNATEEREEVQNVRSQDTSTNSSDAQLQLTKILLNLIRVNM